VTQHANPSVTHNAARHRFESATEAGTAIAEYVRDDDTITFTHTQVPSELEGMGIGSSLARAALEHARDEGLQVVPRCPFIAAYIQEHDEFAPLLLPQADGKGRSAP